MPSLTRAEAIERANLLRVDSYRISLLLTEDDPEFASTTTIRFKASTAGAATFVDCKAVAVESAVLNGEDVDLSGLSEGRLPLTNLRAENELTIVSTMAFSADGEGLHRHVDPADSRAYCYAMSFLDAGPRWFTSFDQPDLKATYEIEVRCPVDWIVIGNGAATRHEPGHWSLATTRPLSTYFVTLVAGPYHSVTAEHDGIKLGLHARASLAASLDAEAPEMLEITRRAFDRYHELFGIRYPFGEYHQAFCPDFNAGAMENPGCVTLRDQYVFRSAVTEAERGVRANTIVHEMAHMWFGDLVTMRWWDDLWLNESFAEYMAHRVCSEITDYAAWTEFGIRRKDWGYVADQAPSTHPVAGNGSADAASALADFDGISYAKGASALKQLAAFLGDEIFFSGLRSYFARHSYSNAEFRDLMTAWTDAGAQGLDDWSAQWLRTSGLDTISAAPASDQVTLTRFSPDASRRPHAIHVAGFDAQGSVVFNEPVAIVANGPEPLRLETGRPVTLAVADSIDETWAKIRFGENNWPAVRSVLAKIENPLTRVVVFNAIRDSVRDADLNPAEALNIVLAALSTESEAIVIADLLQFSAHHLAGTFAPVGDRAARLGRVAELAASLLDAAKPGSDPQLVAARAFIRSSRDSARLEAWLAGNDVPDQLRVDAELRWAIVARLAALGSADGDLIGAELQRDRSTSGYGHAARARALRPDAESKRIAWRLLTEPSETPAYELYATAEAFFEPSQTELTHEYVARYFTDLPATSSHRRGWSLARVTLLSYPTTSASAQTLELAEVTLARSDLDPGVRRSLVDGTDALRRALRSLTRYGSG
ncbi:aminopeptidase N [Jatrophihabitans sp. DSM 45814]